MTTITYMVNSPSTPFSPESVDQFLQNFECSIWDSVPYSFFTVYPWTTLIYITAGQILSLSLFIGNSKTVMSVMTDCPKENYVFLANNMALNLIFYKSPFRKIVFINNLTRSPIMP